MTRLTLLVSLVALTACGQRHPASVLSDGAPVAADLGPAPGFDGSGRQPSSTCSTAGVSVTTDRLVYTLEQAKAVELTVCSGTAQTLYLWICNPAAREHLDDGKWKGLPEHTCKMEALTKELPPNTPLSITTGLALAGEWRFRVEHGAVRDGKPSGFALSRTILVQSSLVGRCSVEKACPNDLLQGTPICLRPGEQLCGGVGFPHLCDDDADCDTLGDSYAFQICEPTPCGGTACVAGCFKDSDCAEGSTCGADHRCRPAPCKGAGDCPQNFVCEAAGATCQRASCTASSQCFGSCVEGLCFDVPGTCAACCPP